jgi:hypothetical protein
VTEYAVQNYGVVASPYVKPYFSRDRRVDTRYWLRREGSNFMIGDSKVLNTEDSDLAIKCRHSEGTQVLWELLTRNSVDRKVITESDLEKNKSILELTNVHLEGYAPGGDITVIRGPKFNNVISKLFPQTKRRGHWVNY